MAESCRLDTASQKEFRRRHRGFALQDRASLQAIPLKNVKGETGVFVTVADSGTPHAWKQLRYQAEELSS
jgi:hypothetical protein